MYSLIKRIFQKHEGFYGSLKITQELHKPEVDLVQKRVDTLMHEHSLKAVKARMYRTRPYQLIFQKANSNRTKDLTPTCINQLWLADRLIFASQMKTGNIFWSSWIAIGGG